MIPILSLLLVLTLSILVTRIATVALVHTGLARETARFQARSAFTGAGFTTTESEQVVRHPVRRRILMVLMLLGNAGIVTAVSSLILTFVSQEESGGLLFKTGTLVLGVTLLWAIASSQWVDRHLSRLIDRMLKRYTRIDTRDYASLLHLAGEYRITELLVEEDDWLAERVLRDVRLRQEGVVVLGLNRRDRTFMGAPEGETVIYPGDTLIVYGRTSVFEKLDRRRRGPSGDAEHRRSVREHEVVRAQEKSMDPECGETVQTRHAQGRNR